MLTDTDIGFHVDSAVSILTGLLVFPAGFQLFLDQKLIRDGNSSANRSPNVRISSSRIRKLAKARHVKYHLAIFFAALTALISGLDPYTFNNLLTFQVSRSFFVVSLTWLGLCFLLLTQQAVITLVSISPREHDAITLPRLLFWCWRASEWTLAFAVVWSLLFRHNSMGLDPDNFPVEAFSFLSSFLVALAFWIMIIPSIWALLTVLAEIRMLERALDSKTTSDHVPIKKRLMGAIFLLLCMFVVMVFTAIPKEKADEAPCETGCHIARDAYPWDRFPAVVMRLVFLVAFLARSWMTREQVKAKITSSTGENNQRRDNENGAVLHVVDSPKERGREIELIVE